jgi:hypothetical protein
MTLRPLSWILVLFLLAGCRGESLRAASIENGGPAASDPRSAAAAWAQALRQGSPGASFAWLRPESRALLERHPELVDRVRARVAALGDVAGLELVVRRERAALLAPKKPGIEPILLLLDDGSWRVDVVEVEKSYAPAIAGRLDPPANPENPYRRLVAPPARGMKAELGEIDLYGEAVEDATPD